MPPYWLLAPIILSAPPAWREECSGSVRVYSRAPVAASSYSRADHVWNAQDGWAGHSLPRFHLCPNWRLLLGYGMYFGIGWLLYLKREQIPNFERFAWTQTLIALGIFFIVEPALRLGLLTGGPVSRFTVLLWSTIAGATMVWLFFFGLTGLFLRHFNRPSRRSVMSSTPPSGSTWSTSRWRYGSRARFPRSSCRRGSRS